MFPTAVCLMYTSGRCIIYSNGFHRPYPLQ
jgi:hypothetical protein